MRFKKSIQEILETELVSFKPTTNSLYIQCPICLKDKKKRAIKKTNGDSKCWICGNWMKFESLLKILLGLTEEEIANRYGTVVNVSQAVQAEFSDLLSDLDALAAGKPEEEEKQEEALPEVQLDAFFVPVEQSREGVEYLLKRGVTSPKIWVDYDIQFHTMMGGPTFLIKMNNKVVGWQCRKINPGKGPRMMSMPGEWKSKSLLNFDNAAKAEEIGVFEGPFDALSAEMSGLVSVATLGKIVSKRQIELLRQCVTLGVKRIFLGFDPDAYIEVREFCKKMCKYVEVLRLIVPPHRKDFGECTPEEVREAIENAEPCYAYQAGRPEIYIDV